MKTIRTVDYIYNDQNEVIHALVKYNDGTSETVSSKGKLVEVQNQLKFQSKQILMEQS